MVASGTNITVNDNRDPSLLTTPDHRLGHRIIENCREREFVKAENGLIHQTFIKPALPLEIDIGRVGQKPGCRRIRTKEIELQIVAHPTAARREARFARPQKFRIRLTANFANLGDKFNPLQVTALLEHDLVEAIVFRSVGVRTVALLSKIHAVHAGGNHFL